jgi:large subunit ribosomal protein L17
MRHAVRGRKLGRTSSHREALFRNQLQSLVDKERIITTLPKAKELRPLAERVITHGKQGTVHARRWALRWLLRRDLVKKVFDDIAPRFSDRPGGYLRIVKLGPRQGDGAEMAVIELVDFVLSAKSDDAKGAKGDADGKGGKAGKAAAGKAAKGAAARGAKAGKADAAEAEEGEEGAKKPAKKIAKAGRKPAGHPQGKGKMEPREPRGGGKGRGPSRPGAGGGRKPSAPQKTV